MATPAPPGVELEVMAGPNVGLKFPFAEHDTFMVGRDNPQVQFSLPGGDGYVSRYHLIVEANPPLVRVRDMGSRNGTLVNGNKVDSADLYDGDEIRIGLTTLRVRVTNPSPPRPTGVETLTLGPAVLPPSPPPRENNRIIAPVEPVEITVHPTAPGWSSDQHQTFGDDRRGYTILREIGRGGMGVVYEARHTVSGRTVAVKTIHPAARPTPTAIQKFLREAEVVRHLDHPHIVRYADAGEANGILWFAMEFIPGADARGLVSGLSRPLEVGRACRWVVQLLDALQYAHTVRTPIGTGFVHRDVKPSNVLVTTVDGREQIKLADFGLAKAYEGSAMSGLTVTGSSGGTPHFMPPEQVKDMRSVKPPADIYSTGATLYWLLSKEYLFTPPPGGFQEPHQLYVPILEHPPVPLASRRPDIPRPVVDAIHRALEKSPNARHASAAAFADILRPFAD